MKTLERTLTIIKPDAVHKNGVGDIIEQFEKNGFRILSMKMLEISKHQAEQFYAVHASRPFFGSLTDFMRIVLIRQIVGVNYLRSRRGDNRFNIVLRRRIAATLNIRTRMIQ